MAKMTAVDKNQIISEYIRTQDGRRKLAASMAQPAKLRIQYQSVAMKCLNNVVLPYGAEPAYEGARVVRIDFEDLPEELTTVNIALRQIQMRRFDLVERAQQMLVSNIQTVIDEAFLDVAFEEAEDITGQFDGPCNDELDAAITKFQSQQYRASRFVLNARDYATYRKEGREMFELSDLETNREMLRSGLMSTYRDTQFITSRICPVGTALVTAEDMGEIIFEMNLVSADDPLRRTIGFRAEGHVIMAIDPKAALKFTPRTVEEWQRPRVKPGTFKLSASDLMFDPKDFCARVYDTVRESIMAAEDRRVMELMDAVGHAAPPHVDLELEPEIQDALNHLAECGGTMAWENNPYSAYLVDRGFAVEGKRDKYGRATITSKVLASVLNKRDKIDVAHLDIICDEPLTPGSGSTVVNCTIDGTGLSEGLPTVKYDGVSSVTINGCTISH